MQSHVQPPLMAIVFDLESLIAALVYAGIGTVLFGLVWVFIAKVSPFSIRKEIEEDHNTALAIVLAAIILGIAHIIAAAVGG